MSQTHVMPAWKYFAVFFALIGLTLLTVELATVDLGPYSATVALLIAGAKTMLVVLYFMHLRHGSRLLKLIAGAAGLWFLIMIALTLADYRTRPNPEGWEGWQPPIAVETEPSAEH